MKHSYLKIIERVPSESKQTRVRCECSICGNIVEVRKSHVTSGAQESCGCSASLKPKVDITGHTINGVLVMGYVGKSFWRVRFSCGHTSDLRSDTIKRSMTGKCHACAIRDILVERNTSHGMSQTPTYNSWLGMQSRCYYPKNNRHQFYMEKGITVHPRWLESFENFYEDMGECPKGWSLERLDLDKNYSPDNCIWASDITQANNKTNNILIRDSEGVQWSLRRWCDILNINYKKAWHQLRNKKMSIEDILGTGYTVVQMR